MGNLNIYADPLLTSSQLAQGFDYNDLLKRIEQQLAQVAIPQAVSQTPIWDLVDSEVNSLTEQQKMLLLGDELYSNVNNELLQYVQECILEQMKPIVEQSEKGKSLLEKQLAVVKDRKSGMLEEQSKELALFTEYKNNYSDMSYDEFLKTKGVIK